MKAKITVYLLSITLVGFLAGCGDKAGSNRKGSRAVNVHVAKVVRQGLEKKQLITGSIEAYSNVRIYNQEPGRIKSLDVYPGDPVEKGQLITVIDDAILIREFEKARALHRQAKIDLKRLKRLIPRKLASDEQLAQAQTAVDQASAEENLFKTRLSYSRILAPMNGIVTERLREPGDIVPLHSHILSIADISQLKITLSLSELTISQLKEDMPVSIRIDALGDSRFAGKIQRIYPTIDVASRQGTIEIIFNEIPQDALPGQLCRVEINTITAPRLVIPAAAIQNDSIGEFVYRVEKDDKVKLVRIQTGIQINDQVEVISGLSENNIIVTKGFQGLGKAKTVKIIDKTAKPEKSKNSQTKKQSTP